jgi:hypothetical protein
MRHALPSGATSWTWCACRAWKEALDHLAQKGALLGVATGNLEAIGWIKIEEAGLREWFRFGGFSDHFPIRSELIGQAAQQGRELAGGAPICVVGDTPRDIEAARANFLSVIAVATGRYSFDELLKHQPESALSSLADLLGRRGGRARSPRARDLRSIPTNFEASQHLDELAGRRARPSRRPLYEQARASLGGEPAQLVALGAAQLPPAHRSAHHSSRYFKHTE